MMGFQNVTLIVMRWSKLFIPTLREEPAEGDPHSRLLIRAGYARAGVYGLNYLFLGQRSFAKIAAVIRQQLDAMDGQEVALGCESMAAVARGDLRSYKQLPQLWYQQQRLRMDSFGVGVNANDIREALRRALVSCGLRATVDDPEGDSVPEEFHTPGVKTIADIAAFTEMPESSQIKSVVMMCGGELVLTLVRGDHTLSETKLRVFVDRDVRAATLDEIRAKFGADPGSLGPVGLQGVRILADEALRGRRNMISGANKSDYHLRCVTPERDFIPEFVDLRMPIRGVGHEGTPFVAGAFLLGSVKEEHSDLRILNETGAETTPAVISADISFKYILAAIAARRDESGLVMPPPVAPFSVVITPVNIRDDAQGSAAEQLYEQAKASGCDALLDDRDERPGVKFKDSELIGIPWRVTVGKKLADGLVEVFERHDKSSRDVPVMSAIQFVRDRWDAIA